MEILNEIEIAINSLEKNVFNFEFARPRYETTKMILEMIPVDAVAGIGDSVTLRQVGVFESLTERRSTTINPIINIHRIMKLIMIKK